ncbi:hypothetical protein NDU88_007002 [Pleurodeles waltl]|uniref:Uncharacterized protein n=1 Tax=Pleurodeles waltl TaxID=8319 RepID=A0AAV7QQJ8_PLEWA|nr:hypothetical protein NDU88_007002 [Pleurodeles waltl]
MADGIGISASRLPPVKSAAFWAPQDRRGMVPGPHSNKEEGRPGTRRQHSECGREASGLPTGGLSARGSVV